MDLGITRCIGGQNGPGYYYRGGLFREVKMLLLLELGITEVKMNAIETRPGEVALS